MARPARESAVGEVEDRSAEVEAVSAASSSERRDSWVEAKVGTSTAFGGIVAILNVEYDRCS